MESQPKMFGVPASVHKLTKQPGRRAMRSVLPLAVRHRNMSVRITTIQVAKAPSTVGPNVETSSRTIPVRVTTVQCQPVDGIKSVQELVAGHSQCKVHSQITSGINAKVKEPHHQIISQRASAHKQIRRLGRYAMRSVQPQTTWLLSLAQTITTLGVKVLSMVGPNVVTSSRMIQAAATIALSLLADGIRNAQGLVAEHTSLVLVTCETSAQVKEALQKSTGQLASAPRPTKRLAKHAMKSVPANDADHRVEDVIILLDHTEIF